MEQRKTYSIGELVKELQLPRSTVVGWLSRYEHYIDFEMRGRRRVYPETALAILKEIAELREQDMSLLKIEDELAKRHPIQAKPAPEPINRSTKADETDRQEEKEEGAEHHLPTVKSKSEELAALFGHKFDEISRYIADEQQQRAKLSSRLQRWYLGAMLLLLLLLISFVAAVFAVQQILVEHKSELAGNRKLLQNQGKTLLQQLENNQAALQTAREKIRQQTMEINRIGIKLDRDADNYRKNIAILKAGLQEQRRQFAIMLQKTLKNAEEAKSRELAKQREAFAKQQLERLKQLESVRQQLKKQQQQIELLKMRLAAKQASLEEVMRRQAGQLPANRRKQQAASSQDKQPDTGPHLPSPKTTAPPAGTTPRKTVKH